MAHYKRPIRFELGQALVACSQCGFPYCYPDEIVRRGDGNFYCLRTCDMSKTVLDDAKERASAASARKPDQEVPTGPLGPRPGWR